MSYIETDCGTCNTEGLLTVDKVCLMKKWFVRLKYKARKDDINLQCIDEKQADECIAKIRKGLSDSGNLWGGAV